MILLEADNFLLGSFLNCSMIRRFGFHVSCPESVLLQYANSYLNKTLPTIGAGAAFRVVFLAAMVIGGINYWVLLQQIRKLGGENSTHPTA